MASAMSQTAPLTPPPGAQAKATPATVVTAASKVDAIVVVKDLHKPFDPDVKAVAGISFDVKRGEIFGFLGPNGAGKSTTIKILTTLLQKRSGRAVIDGPDGGADPRAATYSGGMRRRLDLAMPLISKPKLLFLDEPTTGLDPQNRIGVWNYIKSLNEQGMTIFLTTQYMEEADHLADRLCIIDRGKLVAQGTPAELKAEIGADVIQIAVRDENGGDAKARAREALQHLPSVREVQDFEAGGAGYAEEGPAPRAPAGPGPR